MKPYGQKYCGTRTHTHNSVCGICVLEKLVEKNTARKEAEKEIQEQLDSKEFYASLDEMESDFYDSCYCEHCLPKHENQGNGWKKI